MNFGSMVLREIFTFGTALGFIIAFGIGICYYAFSPADKKVVAHLNPTVSQQIDVRAKELYIEYKAQERVAEMINKE